MVSGCATISGYKTTEKYNKILVFENGEFKDTGTTDPQKAIDEAEQKRIRRWVEEQNKKDRYGI